MKTVRLRYLLNQYSSHSTLLYGLTQHAHPHTFTHSNARSRSADCTGDASCIRMDSQEGTESTHLIALIKNIYFIESASILISPYSFYCIFFLFFLVKYQKSWKTDCSGLKPTAVKRECAYVCEEKTQSDWNNSLSQGSAYLLVKHSRLTNSVYFHLLEKKAKNPHDVPEENKVYRRTVEK